MKRLASILLAALLVPVTTGCASDAASEPECTRQCGSGLVCKRVDDPYLEGAFTESCVPASQGCDPACDPGFSCQSNTCVKDCDPACPDYRTCEAGTCVTPPGGFGCSQILECIGDCDDSACAEQCEADGNAIGSNLFAVFENCVDTNSCTDTPCIDANCTNELRGCLGLPPTCSPACEPGYECSANAQCVPVGAEVCDPPCPAGLTCVNQMCQLGGGGCGGQETACLGSTLQVCENGQTTSYDCSQIRPNCVCAYSQEQGKHDCSCNQGSGTPCDPPCPFPTQCINGVCEQ